MAVLIIPVRKAQSHQRFQVELDRVTFNLTLHWNQREGYWYLTVADSAGAAIASGLKIVANWPLLRRIASHTAPKGEIMALDPTGKLGDPGLEDLGSTFPLVYLEEADLP